jgi:N-acetyl-gamma-glutamyl-phosphate reductase
MYEVFTDRARKVMALANQEAQRLNHDYIGTEHILLGIVKEGSGVGANSLKTLGVDLRAVRVEVEALMPTGRATAAMGKLPQTPRAKKSIEYAIEEARSLNHNYVGTEHLLLGLIREHDGVAAQVLRKMGLELEKVRKEILHLLGATMEDNLKDASPLAEVNLHVRGKAIRVGIVGVSGYGGGEALRLCANHPTFEVVYAAGEGSAGQKLGERFPGIGKLSELLIQKWDAANLPELDLLFASLPSGESKQALAKVNPATKIVDIGGDHRFADGWVYGLADVWPEAITGQTRLANPGCYAAATLTALAPLLAANLLDAGQIVVDAKSGVSGAGRGGGATFGFADVNEDVSAYGLFKHAQVGEITKAIAQIGGWEPALTFTPHLIPMTRGILATCYGRGNATTADCLAAARKFYARSPFVKVTDSPPHTKWATGSNLVFVSYAADPQREVIIALGAIDNLGKGAAGQAVQNANLMTGQNETAGLMGAPIWP